MNIDLEKIDIVVSRTNATFTEAKEALEKTDGDVIEAIVLLEENQEDWSEDISNKSEDIIDKIKEIIKEGNVTKIIVKKDGKTILNIPLTFAAAGAILAIKPALLGLGVALVTRCTIEIVKEDGDIIKINELIDEDRDKNMEDKVVKE